MKRALAALLFAALAACGGTTVGRTCTQNNDCDNGQVCYTFVSNGYCSKGCAIEGGTNDCPSNTVCTLAQGSLYCANVCNAQEDCREGLECNGVTGTSAKSCRPKAK